ncbi:arginase family protein, partial [Rhizobium ruizarguesonis]
ASLPYKEVNFAAPDFGDLQVSVVGIPMDLGVSNLPGSRFGPRAVRGIERIGPYHHVQDWMRDGVITADRDWDDARRDDLR